MIGLAIDPIGLAIELGDAIGLSVDVADLSVDPPIALLLAVLHDGVKIHEGRPGAYGRFPGALALADRTRDRSSSVPDHAARLLLAPATATNN